MTSNHRKKLHSDGNEREAIRDSLHKTESNVTHGVDEKIQISVVIETKKPAHQFTPQKKDEKASPTALSNVWMRDKNFNILQPNSRTKPQKRETASESFAAPGVPRSFVKPPLGPQRREPIEN
ncbi:hypothetical protein VN12_08400 [Pirellula sp. SH-Sr6A]|uniref:hypothetical protein n=1 Tax=Pirellula sp. SH-Sr6A TaxID=1632865 RepID=UPI00078EBA67|nr:hypothetical protein [Pirellula sp. SH-Sr6A]AMV32129.1 hypothetical protein VN12_08400 [Pirellula sp. SH-Sr6A]